MGGGPLVPPNEGLRKEFCVRGPRDDSGTELALLALVPRNLVTARVARTNRSLCRGAPSFQQSSDPDQRCPHAQHSLRLHMTDVERRDFSTILSGGRAGLRPERLPKQLREHLWAQRSGARDLLSEIRSACTSTRTSRSCMWQAM